MMRSLLGPRELRELLAHHGLAPNKSYGQNFVIDGNTVRRVVRDGGVLPGELICEVGPGLGSLTLALRQAGARVVAVEIDAGLVRALRQIVEPDPGVTVIHADALRVDFGALLDLHADGSAGFVANLPYNIATPLVLHALHSGVFSRLLVMVQREVGQRWAAMAGDAAYGAVSVKLQALATITVTARVSRAAFYPPPRVDSVTVRLVPRRWLLATSPEVLFPLVEAGFAQRRKRLRNALATPQRSPAAVEAALRSINLNPSSRAEELALRDWDALSVALA